MFESLHSQVSSAFEQVSSQVGAAASHVGSAVGQAFAAFGREEDKAAANNADAPSFIHLKCPECDAALDLVDGLDVYGCQYCGAYFHLDYGSDGARVAQVMARAQARKYAHERQKMEFEEEVRQRKRKEDQEDERQGWRLMIGMFLFLLGLSVVLCWLGGSFRPTMPGEVKLAVSEQELEGKNYQVVVKQLQDAGFEDISSYGLGDIGLINGIILQEGSVDKVSIDGDSSFDSGRVFPEGSKVTVSYHSHEKSAQGSGG